MKCAALREDEAIIVPVLADSSPGIASDSGARVRSAVRRTRWLHEPLVQFLIIGVALFLINGALNHGTSQAGSSYEIALTIDDLRQLQSTFAAQWQRAPSPEEMRGLVENRVRQEVLYREALMLGLDKDDIIIKRRLAQKMQFLAEACRHPRADNRRTQGLVWKEQRQIRLAEPVRLPASLLFS